MISDFYRIILIIMICFLHILHRNVKNHQINEQLKSDIHLWHDGIFVKEK